MKTKEPARYTSEAILIWLNDNLDQPDLIRDFLARCHDLNLAENIGDSSHLYDRIVEMLVTNNVRNLVYGRLAQVKDAIEIYTNAILSKEDRLKGFRKRNPNMVDPDQILKIIEMALQLLLMLMKYLENSKPCGKKNMGVFHRALLKLNGTNPLINLSGIKIKDGELNGVDLRGVYMRGAKFIGTKMRDAKFDLANLRDTKFDSCDLTNSSFINSQLSWADFSNSTLFDIKVSFDTLANILRTNLPLPEKFSAPCCDEIKDALKEIHEDLKSESNLANKALLKISNKIHRHFYHRLVAEKIVEISKKVGDDLTAHNMLLDLFKDHFFSGHRTAKFTKKLNSGLMFFSSSDRHIPFLCNQNQNPLRRELKKLESRLGSHHLRPGHPH